MTADSEIELAQLMLISTREQSLLPKDHVREQSSAGRCPRDKVQQRLAYSWAEEPLVDRCRLDMVLSTTREAGLEPFVQVLVNTALAHLTLMAGLSVP